MDAKRAVVMSVGVLGLVTLLVHAGPLDPPAGPVAPTDKPLGEIEARTVVNATNTPGDADSAFIIDQRGSYYLTENIGGFEDNQILITANNVTLDLNGFTLTGSPSFQNYGVRVEGSQVTIRNGHVRGYGLAGITVQGGTGVRVENVNASFNGRVSGQFEPGTGIQIGESGAVVRCITNNNLAVGVSAASGSSVLDCVANSNGDYGYALNTAFVCRCVSFDNGAGSLLDTGGASTLIDNHLP